MLAVTNNQSSYLKNNLVAETSTLAWKIHTGSQPPDMECFVNCIWHLPNLALYELFFSPTEAEVKLLFVTQTDPTSRPC